MLDQWSPLFILLSHSYLLWFHLKVKKMTSFGYLDPKSFFDISVLIAFFNLLKTKEKRVSNARTTLRVYESPSGNGNQLYKNNSYLNAAWEIFDYPDD